jgi:hypothetical protein
VTLQPKQAEIAFRTLQSEKDAQSGIATMARFAVEAGQPGVKSA